MGVLYLAVENLSRELRFKRENILIVGIIPGPSEPSMNINSYLEPLIDELELLWDGVAVMINGQKKTIRAALSCIACDVPAARKVGGFIGHNGKYGCNRCLKEFKVESFGDYPDFLASRNVTGNLVLMPFMCGLVLNIKMLELRMRENKLNHNMVHDSRLCFGYPTTMLFLHV